MITKLKLARNQDGTHQYTDDGQIPVIDFREEDTLVQLPGGFTEAVQAYLVSPVKLETGDILQKDDTIYRVIARQLSGINHHLYKLQIKESA